MPISLRDIHNATEAYLAASVTKSVSAPVADTPNAISPGEEFTFSITAKNTGDPTGVQLTGVVYHVKLAPGSVAKLKVPSSPPARAGLNPSGTPLTVGSLVSDMYLFPSDNTLEVGQTQTINGLKGKAEHVTPPPATIKAHVHAKVDLGWLFPTTGSPDATRSFNVV